MGEQLPLSWGGAPSLWPAGDTASAAAGAPLLAPTTTSQTQKDKASCQQLQTCNVTVCEYLGDCTSHVCTITAGLRYTSWMPVRSLPRFTPYIRLLQVMVAR